MSDPSGFAKLVPGFDFLQGLVKNAGAALPGIGQWVAPTIDPAELEKRIDELRTVQYWLEQNARMLGATIQALEVQRMTLSTLKTMNVQMEDLRDSLQLRMPGSPPAAAPAAPKAAGKPDASPAAAAPAPAASAAPTPGVVDPMQWWGALTQQFTELATSAIKDGAADAARNPSRAAVTPKPSAPASEASPAPVRAARKTAAKVPARKPAAPRR
ncbi:MAG TPA: PhaM family polyhydroxyalkanoate granule multifunctional regulatory protein [Burkholderiaceae bacterium]